MEEENEQQQEIDNITMDIDIDNHNTIELQTEEIDIKDIEDIANDNAISNKKYNKIQSEVVDDINNENKMIINDQLEQGQSHKKERNNLIRLPLAKIKNTIKLDNDIKLCQKNAYYVIGKLTELFLQEIAKKSHNVCKMSKRKTINIDDINTTIKGVDKYSFIDIASIFHVDIIGDNKEKLSKSNNTIVLQSSSIKALTESKGTTEKDKIKKGNNNKPKMNPNKNTTTIGNINNNNMRIDQMFIK